MSEQRDGTGTGTGVWAHQAAEPKQPEQRAIIKVTNAQGQTRGGMQWGPGVTHTVPKWGGVLCATGVLHCYEAATVRDALALAILRDPEDGGFGSTARAWVCEGSGQHVTNGIKSGHETLTTVREIQLPAVSIEQRVECAIRLAWEVCDEPGWRAWAEGWLDGSDRSDVAARAAAEAWAARSAARSAARAAARAAVRAAWAAEAWAAGWAADAAADAAGWAADAGVDVAAISGSVLLPEWTDEGGDDGECGCRLSVVDGEPVVGPSVAREEGGE